MSIYIHFHCYMWVGVLKLLPLYIDPLGNAYISTLRPQPTYTENLAIWLLKYSNFSSSLLSFPGKFLYIHVAIFPALLKFRDFPTNVGNTNVTSPGTWSHLWFAGVHECPPWCSIVGATVTVHQFFCILH